jgi:hypothetical protein
VQGHERRQVWGGPSTRRPRRPAVTTSAQPSEFATASIRSTDAYRSRAATIECVNAQARCRFGLQDLRVRGLRKVRCVAQWIALTHNLLLWIKHVLTGPAAWRAAA